MQLRTLVTTFALLHFKGGNQFISEVYDELEGEKLGSMYRHICRLKRDGGHPTTATNKYLIQLALQYLHLFGCSRDTIYEATQPVFNIVFQSLMLVRLWCEILNSSTKKSLSRALNSIRIHHRSCKVSTSLPASGNGDSQPAIQSVSCRSMSVEPRRRCALMTSFKTLMSEMQRCSQPHSIR